jgi:hypothetical protein
MNQALIRSDRFLIRSDEPTDTLRSCLAQTPPPIGEQLAADRTSAAWHIGRELQALWSPKLSLCRWTRTWSEALSVHQPAWWATTTGLRTQRRACAGRRVNRQLPQDARDAQRDLRDQRRTPAATRRSRVDRDGPSTRRPRLRQGGRHPRRHDCILSCCGRPAVRSGGAR